MQSEDTEIQEDEDLPAGDRRMTDDKRWQKHDADVKVLLRKGPNFIVYLDQQLDVDWEDTTAYHEELAAEKVDVGKVQGRVTCLEAVPIDHLTEPIKCAFRSILGEAMCLALEKDMRGAQVLLAKAEEFVSARNHEQARTWYVCGCIRSTAAFLVIAPLVMAIYWWRYPCSPLAERMNILGVGMGGAVGALFSILLRVGRAPLDPAAGAWVHKLEGAARVAVGVIGALMVMCAIRAELLLPQLRDEYGIVLACVIAGASERLATALIERVEGALGRAPQKRKGKHAPDDC